MRQRIEGEKGTSDIWNLKQVRGGFVDLEFIAQHLQLVLAAAHPHVLDQTTLTAMERMTEDGVLAPEAFGKLAAAGRLVHELTQILRLCLDQPFDPKTAPAGLKARLVKGAGARDFADLESLLQQSLAAVHGAFNQLVV